MKKSNKLKKASSKPQATSSRNIDVPNKLPAKEYSFFQDVFDVARQIPKGRVTSYGAIAAYLGTKLSARMVGWAMNAAGNAKPKVPAQRVVNRNGMLSGKHHFATPTLMEELLKKDGVSVKNDTVVDFKKRFWDPSEELIL
jgi:methylated-DNA-protein-cysteine methyltransferase-like protein